MGEFEEDKKKLSSCNDESAAGLSWHAGEELPGPIWNNKHPSGLHEMKSLDPPEKLAWPKQVMNITRDG